LAVYNFTSSVSHDFGFSVTLPGDAGKYLNGTDVNFAPNPYAGPVIWPGDVDPTCTGTPDLPTAPPGKVCLYLASYTVDTRGLSGGAPTGEASRWSFEISWTDDHTNSDDVYVRIFWAYTAP
jgi:hypothetical protein